MRNRKYFLAIGLSILFSYSSIRYGVKAQDIAPTISIANNFTSQYHSLFAEPKIEELSDDAEIIRIWRRLPSGISTECLRLTTTGTNNELNAKYSERQGRKTYRFSQRKLNSEETKKVFSIIKNSKFWQTNETYPASWRLETGHTIHLVEMKSQGKLHRTSENIVSPKVCQEIFAIYKSPLSGK